MGKDEIERAREQVQATGEGDIILQFISYILLVRRPPTRGLRC